MHKNENTQNSHSFLALAFFRGICLSRHQRIWIQHKILRFFDTHIDIFQENFFFGSYHIDIFQEKKFWGHNSTFYNLKMQMRKKLYIFKHFAKSKKLFFCQYLSFSVWFPLSLKHWSPLVYMQCPNSFFWEIKFKMHHRVARSEAFISGLIRRRWVLQKDLKINQDHASALAESLDRDPDSLTLDA